MTQAQTPELGPGSAGKKRSWRHRRVTGAHPLIYKLLVEVGRDGAALIQVQEQPGCFAVAPTSEYAAERITPALAAHLAWLRTVGEPGPLRGQRVSLLLAELHDTRADVTRLDTSACFDWDVEAPSAAELERCLRLLGHARASLIDLLGGIPETLLDRPNILRDQDGDPEPADAPTTVRATLKLLAHHDAWLLTRLEESPDAAQALGERLVAEGRRAGEGIELLAAMRQAFVQRVREVPEDARKRVAYHRGERWTLRKVLRRALLHERLHTRRVARTRSIIPRVP